MAYSTPLTAVSNSTFTAAQFNASVRDNILETPAAKFTASGQYMVSTAANAGAARTIDSTTVATTDTTTSTAYTGLAGGPALTITTGTRALVFLTAFISNNSIGQKSFVGCNVTGASTIGPGDSEALEFQVYGSNAEFRGTNVIFYKTLTAGSNTFTMQFRTTAGTSSFANRVITVMAF